MKSLEETITNQRFVGTVLKENSDYVPKRPAKRHNKYRVDIRDMRYLLGKIHINQDDLAHNTILELGKGIQFYGDNSKQGHDGKD